MYYFLLSGSKLLTINICSDWWVFSTAACMEDSNSNSCCTKATCCQNVLQILSRGTLSMDTFHGSNSLLAQCRRKCGTHWPHIHFVCRKPWYVYVQNTIPKTYFMLHTVGDLLDSCTMQYFGCMPVSALEMKAGDLSEPLACSLSTTEHNYQEYQCKQLHHQKAINPLCYNSSECGLLSSGL